MSFKTNAMKEIFTLILLFLSLTIFGQIENKKDFEKFKSISKLTTIDSPNCDSIKKYAESDIKNGNIIILHGDRTQPITNKTDFNYEKNYNLKLYKLDDLTVYNDCMKIYNWIMFDYLNDKYGDKWLEKIRDDIVGLDEWKKR
jgi:hypothetical protein